MSSMAFDAAFLPLMNDDKMIHTLDAIGGVMISEDMMGDYGGDGGYEDRMISSSEGVVSMSGGNNGRDGGSKETLVSSSGRVNMLTGVGDGYNDRHGGSKEPVGPVVGGTVAISEMKSDVYSGFKDIIGPVNQKHSLDGRMSASIGDRYDGHEDFEMPVEYAGQHEAFVKKFVAETILKGGCGGDHGGFQDSVGSVGFNVSTLAHGGDAFAGADIGAEFVGHQLQSMLVKEGVINASMLGENVKHGCYGNGMSCGGYQDSIRDISSNLIQTKEKGRYMWKNTLGTLFAFIVSLLLVSSILVSATAQDVTFTPLRNWPYDEMKSHIDKIVMIPCFEHHECALVKVPCSWDIGLSDPCTYDLALVRYHEDPTRQIPVLPEGEPIFVNSGGPGLSAVDFVRAEGDRLKVLAPSLAVFGLDQRGFLQRNSLETHGVTGAEELFDDGNRESKRCSDKLGGINGAMRRVGLDDAARDLKHVNELVWKQLFPGKTAKINMWGMSWAGLLAQLLAELNPLIIGKVIVDSTHPVSQYTDYVQGTAMKIKDVEKAVSSFYHYCSKGECPLNGDGTLSAAKIRENVEKTLSYIKVADLYTNLGTIVTYQHVAKSFYRALYTPEVSFKKLAQDLHDASNLYFHSQPQYITTVPSSFTYQSYLKKAANDWTLYGQFQTAQVDLAYFYSMAVIDCGGILENGLGLTSNDAAGLLSAFKTLGEVSSIGAHGQISNIAACIGYKELDKPTSRPKSLGSDLLKTPILFIGNARDPVTPLQYTFDAADSFPNSGSRVVYQDITGHCVFGRVAPEMDRIIRDYLSLSDSSIPAQRVTKVQPQQWYVPFKGPVEDLTNDPELMDLDLLGRN
ncbi:hypothetical protein BJ508DRAFT_327636 [Ascobolus immersus RN42]|uniref:Peptidase S33 tripeptidyl aminopeptidase-like C-terminal domain-containing protein n=1 Tax=Ascobolus immersus RN42 TaxID=1160509 RepID=A0A3N4I208_ASCIM|nr:hypothetical protein BJ508DRAFT_327636 [Ascobolus immersus RN42]